VHVPAVIEAFDQVVVSDLPLARGTHLSSSDLRLEIMDVSRLHSGYFREISDLSGHVARRSIKSGQVMSPALVDPARMINRGERVVITAESPGLSIRSTGEAMQDGAYGELIRVKNTSSDKIVEGRITAPGQIKVSL
jgi:flagella basal body P-ring formation protein FlgA